MNYLGTDWLALIEKKRKRQRTLKIAAVIAVFTLIVGFVALYVENGPSVYGPGPIEVTITPNKPYFIQGENITFTVTIINKQSWPIAYPNSESTRIEKEGIIYQNEGLNIDYAVKVPTYPANMNTIHSWRWLETKNDTMTIPHEVGNYSLTYEISGYGYSASTNCSFEIRQNQTKRNNDPIQISLTPDKPYFLEGEAVTFTGSVINAQNQPVPYPSCTSTSVKMIEGSSNADDDDIGRHEYVTYDVNNVPTYPANTNTSFTWTLFNSKNGDPYGPGSYILTYSLSGHNYDVTVKCVFEIRKT